MINLITNILWSQNIFILIGLRLMLVSTTFAVIGVITRRMEKSDFYFILFFIVGIAFFVLLLWSFLNGCMYIHFGCTVTQSVFAIIDFILIGCGLVIWMILLEAEIY